MDRTQIEAIVLQALTQANLARPAHLQLDVSPRAMLFGEQSPLDSFGLVALLIDIEDTFGQQGHTVVLSDERAMSQRRSPFRDVTSLVDYIDRLMKVGSA